MKRLVTVASLSLLFAASAFAQCRTGTPSRVSFERGKASAQINGEMQIRGEACYALRARAGQQMSVSVSSAHDYARFNLFPPSKDHTIAHETSEWTGVLPETGDYVIALYPRTNDEAGSFTLYVSVTAATANAASSTSSGASSSSDRSTGGDANGESYVFDASDGAWVFDGRAPKGFETVNAFELPGVALKLAADGAAIVSVSENPGAVVYERGGRQFKSKSATVNGDEISFETQAVRGVSYQFTGRFFKRQVQKGQLLDAGLKGRLIKLVNGQKVAEAQISLYQEVGG